MNWKKFTFITILGIIIILASFFMITESARYYTFFYESGAWQPLFLASLLEVFVLALAVMKIGTKRIFGFIQKFIMISVFTVIITAAGIQAVNPTLESLETVSKQEQLSDILKEEYKTLKKDREVFEKQKQRLNTAIAAAERRKIVSDLKDLFNQDIKTDKGRVALLNILLLFTIRFIVQLSNVFCASMLGVYFRRENKPKEKRTMKWNIFKIFKNKKEVEEPQIRMTPREFVLSKFPNAVCKGTINTEKVRTFRIYENSKTNAKIIGVANKKRMAWRSAKNNLKG